MLNDCNRSLKPVRGHESVGDLPRVLGTDHLVIQSPLSRSHYQRHGFVTKDLKCFKEEKEAVIKFVLACATFALIYLFPCCAFLSPLGLKDGGSYEQYRYCFCF